MMNFLIRLSTDIVLEAGMNQDRLLRLKLERLREDIICLMKKYILYRNEGDLNYNSYSDYEIGIISL